MRPLELRTKNDCAVEGQQQFTRQKVQSVFNCIVSSHYLSTASEQTEDFVCAVVVVMYGVCKSVRLLYLFVVTRYKCLVNSVFYPNAMSSHKYMTVCSLKNTIPFWCY
jgi:hypothetical protein